jgi:hypothetical protein
MKDYCAIHGYEPATKGCYKICGECWHCFVTEEELIEKDFRIRAEISNHLGTAPEGPEESGEQILICPECTHGF